MGAGGPTEGAFQQFCWQEGEGGFLPPPPPPPHMDGMLVHCMFTTSIKFTDTHLYT